MKRFGSNVPVTNLKGIVTRSSPLSPSSSDILMVQRDLQGGQSLTKCWTDSPRDFEWSFRMDVIKMKTLEPSDLRWCWRWSKLNPQASDSERPHLKLQAASIATTFLTISESPLSLSSTCFVQACFEPNHCALFAYNGVLWAWSLQVECWIQCRYETTTYVPHSSHVH